MEKVDKSLWKSYNFWFGVIGAIGVIFSIFTFMYVSKPDLNYYVLANTSVLDVKEKVTKLNVTYDSINILKSDQNISIIIVEIKNEGDKNISINDYDQSSPIGLKVVGGKILKRPELITSSDNYYFRDVISSFQSKSINFHYKLIDESQFFRIKLLVLHNKKVQPSIVSFGKISGMSKIEVKSSLKPTEKANNTKNLILTFLLTCTLFLFIFFLNRSRKEFLSTLRESIEYRTLYNNLLQEKQNEDKIKNILEFEAKPQNVGELYSVDELENLEKNTLVFHERFGIGKVIKINKIDNFESVGEFSFENDIKRLKLKFTLLYKLV